MPKGLREAAEQGKARFESNKAQPKERTLTPEEAIAQFEIEQAREWVERSLPGIIEECASRGEDSYCLGWCEESKINIARRRAFACEEADLVITTTRVFELKSTKRDRTNITKDDIRVVIYFVLEWEL